MRFATFAMLAALIAAPAAAETATAPAQTPAPPQRIIGSIVSFAARC